MEFTNKSITKPQKITNSASTSINSTGMNKRVNNA